MKNSHFKFPFSMFTRYLKTCIEALRTCLEKACIETNDGIEDVEHFLLLCLSFEIQRRDYLAGVSESLRSFVQIDTLPNNVLIECLLYGDKNVIVGFVKVHSHRF